MMTDKYTIDEIEKAILLRTAQAMGPQIIRDVVIAELTKPKYSFRAGEIALHCNKDGDYISLVKTGNNGNDTGLDCRPLNYTELPTYVHDLVEFIEWAARAQHVPDFVRNNAQDYLTNFNQASGREVER